MGKFPDEIRPGTDIMNVIIFTDTFLPKIDGVAISVENFCRILSDSGHSFLIFCPRYGKDDTDSLSENIKIIRFKNASLPSYPDIKIVIPSYKKIKKAIIEFQPDLIHIQTPGLLGQYGVTAAKKFAIPLIGTNHTLVSEQHTYISLYRLLKIDVMIRYIRSKKKVKKRLHKIERKSDTSFKKMIILKLCNRLYEAGERIISPSHLIKEELFGYGITKPIDVISNGIDLDTFLGTYKSKPSDTPRLLHVGRISYEKNCDVVLNAFALILKDTDATLDIIGDGPALNSLKQQARDLHVEKRVHFPGFIAHNSLPEVYRNYDLFLTASTMETQGLVVLEAMAGGLPCIGVKSYALPELIHDGRNGFICAPYNHIEMAEKTLSLLKNHEKYCDFSRQSLKIALEHDVHKCARELESVYKLTIDNFNEKSPSEPVSASTIT